MNDKQDKINLLNDKLEKIYIENSSKLLFHGWHHIIFVQSKSVVFANSIGADEFLVESSALVHDLNYLVKVNTEVVIGENFREQILRKCNYSDTEVKHIEKIVREAETKYRDINISDEAKALSDADTLFKVIPTTSILLTGSYIKENKVDLLQLAQKITSEQNKLFDSGIYFYTDIAKKNYLTLAKIHYDLWNSIITSLEDPDVIAMLKIASKLKVI